MDESGKRRTVVLIETHSPESDAGYDERSCCHFRAILKEGISSSVDALDCSVYSGSADSFPSKALTRGW